MYYHIILTEKCNSKCKYCYEKSLKEFDNKLSKKWRFEFNCPCNLEININKIKRFIKKDNKPRIILYGGEPLLQRDKIKEIINSLENIPNIRFYMQTNGKLLHKFNPYYLKKISKILISIDGGKKRTDYNRGKGTYNKVIQNINQIRKYYRGEIVARMTISQEFPDIFKQVKNILKTKNFDSIHWQIDAGFYEHDFNEKEFKEFVKKYNQSLSKLIQYWVKKIKKGKVLKIYPFLGIFESLYYNKKTKLRCGSGYANYTITTNGKITACPIMNNIKDFYCGNLNMHPNNLKQIKINGICKSCKYLDICGGRCLYSNKAQLWPIKGQELICKTIIYLIKEINNQLPNIKNLIQKKIIKKSDFKYEKYFGPEIIP